MNKIQQWNVRGYGSNYEDLQVLIKDHQPACLCLQETMHGDIVLRGLREYIAFSNSVPHAVPGTGLTVLVRKHVPAYAVPLNTPLSALAMRAKLQKEYTICNIYIEHDINLQVGGGWVYHLFIYLFIGWSNRTAALFLWYRSAALCASKGIISPRAICYLWRFIY